MMRTLYKFAILLASIGIYTWFVGSYIIVLFLLASVVCMSSRIPSRWAVLITLLSLIAGFVILKYQITSDTITLPIGYSVFAFSCISFVVDRLHKMYDGTKSYLDTFCYLFFFPKMLAGPIVRFEQFQNQLNLCQPPSTAILYKSFKIIIYASFCKFCVADNLSWFIGAEWFGVNAWLISLLFAIQLYLDFYAYSNYAIAFALIVGIELPVSFNSPYKTTTFRAFWRRWNITVSEWLKDYVYIPLGGNKGHGKVRTGINVMITFVVSGVWHGATLPFIVWGSAHGMLVILERLLFSNFSKHRLTKTLYGVIVFVLVVMLWQLFRLDGMNDVVSFANHLIVPMPISYELLFCSVGTCVLLAVIDNNTIKELVFTISDLRKFIYREVSLVCAMLLMVILFHSQPNFDFFYFKF